MEPALVSTMSAVLGSLVGASATIATAWVSPGSTLTHVFEPVVGLSTLNTSEPWPATPTSSRVPSGVSYVLERSINLLSWTNVATNTAPAAGLISYTNTVSGEAAYFRARFN